MGFLLCDAWAGCIIRANRNLVRGPRLQLQSYAVLEVHYSPG